MRQLLVADLGSQPYAEALAFQREVARARIAGDVEDDVLLLVEHPPVVTLGRSAKSAHLLASPDYLRQQGVEVFEVERGGDVTFHGPGQLVGYPIVDLKQHRRDLHWYLRQVEQVLIDALATYGLRCERNPPYTGVWIDNRKIASIGVHARDWVTWHGFALNVATDLRFFDLIVPCGIQSVRMTSLHAELPDERPSLDQVGQRVATVAAQLFDLAPRSITGAELASAVHASTTASARASR
ncbi:MAG TPA: lipoyl(octanoyl) transferase LipB [Gemmatimonadaceae bacterium]|nr:lipoyl(octanoyl) transferase LipB [Gemmatimonadaceae bacterium]